MDSNGMNNLQQLVYYGLKNVKVCFDEPMHRHTSMQIGGPADVFLVPATLSDLEKSLRFVRAHGLPFFLLGGGTNILVSDRGIRGVVIHTGKLSRVEVAGNHMTAQAGATVEAVCKAAAECSLTGLEFIHGMPGSIGGAVWMNARCYGGAISDVLEQVVVVNTGAALKIFSCDQEDFGYKRSPFQKMSACIWEVELRLGPGQQKDIYQKMRENRSDRERKGHYTMPSAGSMFKNNHAFGAPTGQILDELGLRNTVSGGAAVAAYHGNIFVNHGHATAADVLALIRLSVETAAHKKNIRLEPEVCFVGDWQPDELSFLGS